MTVTDAMRDANPSLIYFHREMLCRSLDGRAIDLLTISDLRGIDLSTRIGLLGPERNIPLSSATGKAQGGTRRPYRFRNKTFVVLTARVHPGECPGSHMMHGALSFLLEPRDPRALMLREKFVFLIVPMINPDGVVRGHSRVDAAGVDLNRMYSTPSPVRHPAPFCLRQLVLPIARENKLSLFVDMHAHANRKGTFLYGNGLEGKRQVQNLLYAKLVALNTPYLEFTSCNYSEANMFAVSKSGKGKESSARIVWYLETGCVHSYAIEASHVAGRFLNTLPRHPALAAEDLPPDQLTPRYTPATFGDTGKAVLLGLLDLHNCNPWSRLLLTTAQTLKGMEAYIERQLMVEAAEKLFVLAYRDGTRGESANAAAASASSILQRIMLSLPPEEIPDKLTIRGVRTLPPVTVKGVREFLPMETAIALLAQTPAAGPPRSIACPRVRSTSPRSRSSCVDVPAEIVARRHTNGAKKRQASRSKSSSA
ncbi:metallo-peptidase, Clan MC, Family M14 [Strigomonas culicis]|uniref:Metallo-peptidase, Clan MC, Family M14 n=1 Tax=Strigomonas culicis TaxID=28005 RepID=S9TDE4_9TRYP|nr:metallo-peptidase, Clan MC, Family M14 [Strigomonas culicis]|eukprot:EPY16032.1 metallo-peptidase, Clan MC, Family M14 [Strigomonas culicis]